MKSFDCKYDDQSSAWPRGKCVILCVIGASGASDGFVNALMLAPFATAFSCSLVAGFLSNLIFSSSTSLSSHYFLR